MTDGHRTQQQFPSVNNTPPSDHVIIPGGVSPVVDRSNKPVHLIQQEPHPQTQYPEARTIQHEVSPQPIVDRSTKPSSHHIAISDAFLSGIGQRYHSYYSFMHTSHSFSVSYWLIGGQYMLSTLRYISINIL